MVKNDQVFMGVAFRRLSTILVARTLLRDWGIVCKEKKTPIPVQAQQLASGFVLLFSLSPALPSPSIRWVPSPSLYGRGATFLCAFLMYVYLCRRNVSLFRSLFFFLDMTVFARVAGLFPEYLQFMSAALGLIVNKFVFTELKVFFILFRL